MNNILFFFITKQLQIYFKKKIAAAAEPGSKTREQTPKTPAKWHALVWIA